MKNDNRKKCRKNIELFNGETWRGAWRGAESLQARFVEEYRRFFEKQPCIFQFGLSCLLALNKLTLIKFDLKNLSKRFYMY